MSKLTSRSGKRLPGIVYVLAFIFLVHLGKSLIDNSLTAISSKVVIPNSSRISRGDIALINSERTLEKEQGVAALSQKNYGEAVNKFRRSLQLIPNDPETLIYLNNATYTNSKQLTIGVSVPIGSNLNVASEILRGVAQAQTEINRQGGINGAFLKVLIANDENKPEIVEEIAKNFVSNPEILAVVGHNSSNASLAAAPIYEAGNLVAITPTSFADNLTGRNFIYRTVTSQKNLNDRLIDYILTEKKQKNLLACFDEKSPDTRAFRENFVKQFTNKGGAIVGGVCDFNSPDFNPEKIVSQAIASGAEGIYLVPHIDRFEKALAIIQTNEGKLSLYSNLTMYTIKTLQGGQKNVQGMILSAPWHPQVNPDFSKQARKIWHGQINWRTATSYDATMAIANGLKQSPSRQGLQQALKNRNFIVSGATGEIKFLPSGDVSGNVVLLKVESGGTYGYDFIPLNP